MARKDLAGLAALGALGYMLTKDKGDSAPSMRGGAEDERPAPTGMGEATQLLSNRNENFSNEGRTGVTRTPIGAVPRPRASTSSISPASGGPRRGPGFETGSGGGRGPAFGEAEAYRQRQFEEANARANTPEGRADRAKMEQAQALEAVRPEEAMIGGGGLKTVAAMARGLAGRRGAEKLAEYSVPRIGTETVPRIGTEPLKIGTEPLKMTGPSKAELVARDRAARAAGREAERKEFNQRGVDRFVESTFEGGMKRGGKVKKMASGGMARSSASKRGDGIASKGKTKGRIY
jgi:hypothetical protein